MKNFDLGILFARLGLGVCLFMHGFAKILHGIGGVKSILTKAGLPEIVAYDSYIGEVVAPIMIILGIFSRIGALLVIGTSLTIMYAYHGLGIYLSLQTSAALRLKFYIFTSFYRFALSLTEAENTRLEKISAIKFGVKDEIYLILSQI